MTIRCGCCDSPFLYSLIFWVLRLVKKCVCGLSANLHYVSLFTRKLNVKTSTLGRCRSNKQENRYDIFDQFKMPNKFGIALSIKKLYILPASN
jgi:hypothetical protein